MRPRRLIGASGRPLNFTVRFRMHRALKLLSVLLLAVRLDAVCAETHRGVVIDVASDGTCQAAGLHVSCGDIGAKLRDAGIPLDTWITFSGAGTVSYDTMKSTIDSLARAGFRNMKIGFLTEPAH
jgi:biopolymer transport protein ExbD